jgi:hypothetical protein
LLEVSTRPVSDKRILDLAELLRRACSVPDAPPPAAPAPAPPGASVGDGFPIAGTELLQQCSNCGIKPVTARILLNGTLLSGWGEVSSLLGMDARILTA